MFAVEVDGFPVAILDTIQEAEDLAFRIMCGDDLFAVVTVVALYPEKSIT